MCLFQDTPPRPVAQLFGRATPCGHDKNNHGSFGIGHLILSHSSQKQFKTSECVTKLTPARLGAFPKPTFRYSQPTARSTRFVIQTDVIQINVPKFHMARKETTTWHNYANNTILLGHLPSGRCLCSLVVSCMRPPYTSSVC